MGSDGTYLDNPPSLSKSLLHLNALQSKVSSRLAKATAISSLEVASTGYKLFSL